MSLNPLGSCLLLRSMNYTGFYRPMLHGQCRELVVQDGTWRRCRSAGRCPRTRPPTRSAWAPCCGPPAWPPPRLQPLPVHRLRSPRRTVATAFLMRLLVRLQMPVSSAYSAYLYVHFHSRQGKSGSAEAPFMVRKGFMTFTRALDKWCHDQIWVAISSPIVVVGRGPRFPYRGSAQCGCSNTAHNSCPPAKIMHELSQLRGYTATKRSAVLPYCRTACIDHTGAACCAGQRHHLPVASTHCSLIVFCALCSVLCALRCNDEL